MPEGFVHQGQRYEWNAEAQDYEPVSAEAGVGATAVAGGGLGLTEAVNAVNQLFGYDELAQRTNQMAQEQFQQAGGTTIAPGVGEATRVAGGMAPYAAVAAGTGGFGTIPMMAAEGLAGFAFSQGDMVQRSTNALIAAGLAGTPAGAMQLMRGVGAGVRAARMQGTASGVFQSVSDAAADAAAGARGRMSASFGEEVTEQGLPMHELQQRWLRGDRSPEVQQGMVALENSPRGARIAGEQDEAFGNIVRQELGAGPGVASRQEIGRLTDEAGAVIGDIRARYPLQQADQQFMDDIASVAENFEHSYAKGLVDKARANNWTQLEDFHNDLMAKYNRKGTPTEVKQIINAAEEAINDLRARMVPDGEDLNRLNEARYRYAVGRQILDTPNVLKQDGSGINVRSFANVQRRRLRSARQGEANTPMEEALQAMEVIQARQTQGSNTYEKVRNLVLGGLGLAGAGAIGSSLLD